MSAFRGFWSSSGQHGDTGGQAPIDMTVTGEGCQPITDLAWKKKENKYHEHINEGNDIHSWASSPGRTKAHRMTSGGGPFRSVASIKRAVSHSRADALLSKILCRYELKSRVGNAIASPTMVVSKAKDIP